jgi:probable phosphoglycerate mutase
MQAIYTSPLERAIETADIVADSFNLSPIAREQLGELRFGEWEGKTFDELDRDPLWREFNRSRSTVRPPGGELMIEAQTRMVREMTTLVGRHPDETVGIVSHLDPLRAFIAHCLGISLDFFLRFRLDPGSLSIVQYSVHAPHVTCLNRTCELPV